MRAWTAERLGRIIRGGSRTTLRLPLALAGLLWTSVSLATPTHFNIDAGDAPQTLSEFSRQSNLQVLFDFRQLQNVHTQAVRGDLELEKALAALLTGTSLRFAFVNEKTIAFTRVQEQTKPAAAAQSSSPATHWWQRMFRRPTRTPAADPL
jgi:iron complex outermembrane recepter protein